MYFSSTTKYQSLKSLQPDSTYPSKQKHETRLKHSTTQNWLSYAKAEVHASCNQVNTTVLTSPESNPKDHTYIEFTKHSPHGHFTYSSVQPSKYPIIYFPTTRNKNQKPHPSMPSSASPRLNLLPGEWTRLTTPFQTVGQPAYLFNAL